jgi:hypothetical protein
MSVAAEVYRPCEGCGTDLLHLNLREGARFCSGSCRQKAYRRRKLSTVPDPRNTDDLENSPANPQVSPTVIRNAVSTLGTTQRLSVTQAEPQVEEVNRRSQRAWWDWLRTRPAEDWKTAEELHTLFRKTGRYPWEHGG